MLSQQNLSVMLFLNLLVCCSYMRVMPLRLFFQRKALFYFFFMDKVQLSQQGMPQQGKSLLLTAKSPEVTVPRLINLGRMKG